MLNRFSPRRAGRGLVLPLTLVVLVVMALAATALARSAMTGNRVAANLAFHEAATRSADVAIEQALAWLQTHRGDTLLNGDQAPVDGTLGYFASRPRAEEPTDSAGWTAYWDRTLTPAGRINRLPADAAGNTVEFVVHRLCDAAGDAQAASTGCVTPPAGGVARDAESRGAGRVPLRVSAAQYYRITVRVAGRRHAVSFVQAIVVV